MQFAAKAAGAALLVGGLFVGSSVAPSATGVTNAAALSRALPAIERGITTPDTPAQADNFFNAAALAPSSVPGQMQVLQNGPVTPDQVSATVGSDVSGTLSSLGFVEGYEQAFRTTNLLGVLTGSPAGAGDAIWVFSDASGASTWNQFESQNVNSIGLQSASSQGVDINLSGAQPLSLPALGDESSATELQGTATLSGQPVDVYVDVAFMRRNRVEYTAIVVGLQSQQSTLVSLAQTLDGSVAAAMPLLGS